MAAKSFTTGCLGLSLTADEYAFLKNERPWGLILFAHNIDEPQQVAELCAAFRDAVGDQNAPVLIDQEGGRVQRLKPPNWAKYPPAAAIGALYQNNRQQAHRAAWLLARLHAFDLLKLGITINCLPVLDVITPGAHDAIGDRSFGNSPKMVIELGQSVCDGLIAGGVMPVIKHMPGQGRSKADSHDVLPVVDASRDQLEKTDFVPFKALASVKMAMTTHIVFRAIDPTCPVTTSKTMISQVIRKELGFDGLLLSDDVSMKALSGDCGQRSKQIFAAGVDIVLHCNGDMTEMKDVAANSPEMSGKTLARAQQAMQGIGIVDASDEQALRDEFATVLAGGVS